MPKLLRAPASWLFPLLLACILSLLPGEWGDFWQGWFPSLSETIKQGVLWVLPAIVWVLVTASLAQFGKEAPRLLCHLLFFELASNTTAVLLGFLSGMMWGSYAPPLLIKTASLHWHSALPTCPGWWSASYAAALGVACGLAASLHTPTAILLARAREILQQITSRTMPWIARWMLPGYLIAGSASLAGAALAHLGFVVVGLLLMLGAYLLLLFWLAAQGHWGTMWRYLVQSAPAGAVGATSMCSLAALPWTIEAGIKNCADADLARVIVPATASVQMPGDCFTNLFLMGALLPCYGVSWPTPWVFLTFTVAFVGNRFAAVGVSGGALLLMLPLFESYLHAPIALIALMTLCNRLFEPLITSTNVLGNCALTVLFTHWYRWRKAHRPGRATQPI